MQERERLQQSAKKLVVEGQLLRIAGKNGEGEFLVQAKGQWCEEEEERAVSKLQVKWCPRLYSKLAGGRGWISMMGTETGNDLPESEREQRYISPEEIWKHIVDLKTMSRSTALAVIEAQWDLKAEYGQAVKLEDVPGVGPNYLWELDTNDWYVYPISGAPREDVELKVCRGKRCKRCRVSTVRVATEHCGEQICFLKNRAQVDKSKFRKMIGDENSGAKLIEVWTDGAQRGSKAQVENGRRQEQDGQKGNTEKPRLGSGLRVVVDGKYENYVDMAWPLLGIATNNGAELGPTAKIAEWLKANARVKIYTDSATAIQLVEKVKGGRLNDRERINHPDRNAIMMLQQAAETNPGVMEKLELVKVTSHTGVQGNEAADTCAGLAVDDDDAKMYATTVWIREALEYLLIDNATEEVIMGNARRLIKQKQVQNRVTKWRSEEKYRVQGKFARHWETIKVERRRELAREIASSRKMTKAINSIMLCQDEWGRSKDASIRDKWLCKVCGKEVGCAAHKLKCIGQGKDMQLARLRAIWAEREELKGTLPSKPEWVKADSAKLGDGEIWYSLGGNMGWVPGELMEELAWGYDKICQELDERKKYQAFCGAVAKARRREHRERSVFDKTVERVEEMIVSMRVQEVKYRPSPKWVMECLPRLGVHRELYTTAYDITPLILEHHSRYEEDQVFGMAVGNARQAGLYRGGSCSWINTTRKELIARCDEIQQAIKELDKGYETARHVAVILCNKKEIGTIQGKGGRIMAIWPATLV
jgi:ribonuclease HI